MTPKTETKDLTFTVLKRAVIYARVSTDEQAEHGTSIEAQIVKGKAYAESQGMALVGIFADDYTGTSLDRPELNKVRALLKTGQADVLVCSKTDRLDRSEWGVNLLILLQELKSLGVELHYSENGRRVDLSSPQEMLLESIKGWQAGEDRNTIVKRLKTGKIDRAKQGGVLVFGRPPYGYKQVKKGKITLLEIDESEAAIVRLIYKWYVFGDEDKPLSFYAIALRLTEMNIPSPSASTTNRLGTPKKRGAYAWSKDTIARILASETYIGVWHYRKTTRKNGELKRLPNEQQIAVNVPPIVDRQLWDLAQVKRQDNKKNLRGDSKYEYLMGKRLTCGCCGYKMFGFPCFTKYNHYFYYRCPSKTFALSRECNLPHFRVEAVDNTIWDWVKGIFEDEKRLEAAIKRYLERNEDETAPLKERLNMLEDLIKKHEKDLVQARRDYDDFKNTSADRTKASLIANIENIETLITGFEKQKEGVIIALKKFSINEEDLQAIRDYAAEVRAGLNIANANFQERRWLIEKLDVRATLTIEDGQKIAYVECRLGEKPERLELLSGTFCCKISIV